MEKVERAYWVKQNAIEKKLREKEKENKPHIFEELVRAIKDSDCN